MHNLLIIEDDTSLAEGLTRALSGDTIQVESCNSLREAHIKLQKEVYDLLLLDVNLPDGSGFDFLKEVKQQYRIPVIMLTANDLEMDIVNGLELGADDYITKPFSLAILRARVNTQLNRSTASPAPLKDRYITADYCFDFSKMEFTHGGVSIELSKTEQKLLRIFMENQGITLSRNTLIDTIWTDGAEYVDENALSVTVKRLRDKLHAQDTIQTVYGIGYLWRKESDLC